MDRKTLFVMTFLLAFILPNCSLPQAALPESTGTSLTLMEPVDGAVYQAGDMLQVRSQMTSADGVTQIDLLINGVVARTDKPSPGIKDGSLMQPWQAVQPPGSYTIQTQLTTTSGARASSQIVTIQVGAAEVTPVPQQATLPVSTQPLPSFTLIPTITFTPTASSPVATAFQDANCRFGPGQVYNITGALLNGESAPIVGRNAETTWWVIELRSGANCWVWDGTVTVSGDTSGVPVVAAPPTPTFTPVPVAAPALVGPSGELTCRSSVFLEWNPVSPPNGISRYEWQVSGPGGTQSGSDTRTRVEFFVSCGASYTWQVRAVDGGGVAGPYSSSMSFQIK